MKKDVYWGIIWVDNIRWGNKYAHHKAACVYAYGLHTDDMECINLGTRKNKAFKIFDKLMKDRKLSSY